MGESGKRPRYQRDRDRDRDRDNDGDVNRFRRNDEEGKFQKRRTSYNEVKRDDELIVYRILCPGSVIGSVIGKSGKVINSIRHETRSTIKVVDPFPGANERVILIYCYVTDKDIVEVDDADDNMEPLCPAQDALLKVHSAIANALGSTSDSDKKRKDKEEAHILAPTSQAANIIGKSGATIKKLRGKSGANIQVNPKDASDPAHSCALDFDNFVLISGDAREVKKALFAVSAIMYKFPPKEEIPLDTSIPEVPPSIILASDLPIYQPGSFYQTADPGVPSRSIPSFLGTSTTQQLPELHGYTDTGSTWPAYSSALPVVSGYGGPSRSEELKIRLLCPLDKIGRVIGKGGSSIKSVRQETGAHIEVDDTKADRNECLITVTSTESPDDLKSMAVETVLMLQGKINDNDGNDTVNIRLLVPSKIIGCIIGKSGSIINEMRKRTKADVRISKSENLKYADANDELVEAVGGVGSVRDALVQIVLRLRDDALKDRESGRNPHPAPESLFSGSGGFSMPSILPRVPQGAPLGYDQKFDSGSGLGLISSSRLYGYRSLPVEDNGYASMSSYSSKSYPRLPPPSVVEMLIPSNAVGKVMGRGGANLSNIRKISGAMVEVVDSKSSRGDRVAKISGTPEQKRSAESLIQAFILST